MNSKKTETMYQKLIKHFYNYQLSDVFALIKEMLQDCERADLVDKFNSLETTYSYLLEYTFKGVEDPERPKIYGNLQRDLIELAEKVRENLLRKFSDNKLYSDKRFFEREIIKHNQSVKALLMQITETEDYENPERKANLSLLFNYLFVAELQRDDTEQLKKISQEKELKMHEQSVLVSALTVSLLNGFSADKFELLLYFYKSSVRRVRGRALVGIVALSYLYDKRLRFYPKLWEMLMLLKEDARSRKEIGRVILQLLKTKETKKISDEMRDEILPEMSKFRPKIEDKLDLDQILTDKLIEDENPDWEDLFEDAPDLFNKMEKYSKMQIEGSDVFMSAFSMLKHFPFFQTASNWFLPFYKENREAKEAMEGDDIEFDSEKFSEGLERSSYICNSDKYSFCLNLSMLPKAQKNMISQMFKMELDGMNEIAEEDEILQKDIKDKHIYTRYIQDLYRFCKLHPWVKNTALTDIFATELDIYNTRFYKEIIANEKLLLKIAEYYFRSEFYKDAVKAYKAIPLNKDIARAVSEKTAFSYQKMRDYKTALEYYKRAELHEGNNLWLYKKIAFCNRKIHRYEEALKYYRLIESKQPDNLHTQANIAHCLLFKGEYEEAIQHYFKVEYYEPDNIKVMRPLAWCSFLLNKFDAAETYYKKLLEADEHAYDHINYGHALLCTSRPQEAVLQYREAVKISGIQTVSEALSEDEKHLREKGVEQNLLHLLPDYLKLKF